MTLIHVIYDISMERLRKIRSGLLNTSRYLSGEHIDQVVEPRNKPSSWGFTTTNRPNDWATCGAIHTTWNGDWALSGIVSVEGRIH